MAHFLPSLFDGESMSEAMNTIFFAHSDSVINAIENAKIESKNRSEARSDSIRIQRSATAPSNFILHDLLAENSLTAVNEYIESKPEIARTLIVNKLARTDPSNGTEMMYLMLSVYSLYRQTNQGLMIFKYPCNFLQELGSSIFYLKEESGDLRGISHQPNSPSDLSLDSIRRKILQFHLSLDTTHIFNTQTNLEKLLPGMDSLLERIASGLESKDFEITDLHIIIYSLGAILESENKKVQFKPKVVQAQEGIVEQNCLDRVKSCLESLIKRIEIKVVLENDWSDIALIPLIIQNIANKDIRNRIGAVILHLFEIQNIERIKGFDPKKLPAIFSRTWS